MSASLHVVLVGDYRASAVAHQAIPLAIARAARNLAVTVETTWIHSTELGDLSPVQQSDAVWVVPGGPYADDEAVLRVIRWARENHKPWLGSCAGFQYGVLEYARNVLGWSDACHAETAQDGRIVIAPLTCSLVEKQGEVVFAAESKIAHAYGALHSQEGYHCNFGMNPEFVAALAGHNLKITAWDREGDVRGVELTGHPFYVATLFQSERLALEEKDAPLVIAWLAAALDQR